MSLVYLYSKEKQLYKTYIKVNPLYSLLGLIPTYGYGTSLEEAVEDLRKKLDIENNILWENMVEEIKEID